MTFLLMETMSIQLLTTIRKGLAARGRSVEMSHRREFPENTPHSFGWKQAAMTAKMIRFPH